MCAYQRYKCEHCGGQRCEYGDSGNLAGCATVNVYVRISTRTHADSECECQQLDNSGCNPVRRLDPEEWSGSERGRCTDCAERHAVHSCELH